MNWKQTYGYTEKQIRKFLQATYGDRMYRIAEQYGRKAVFVSNSAQFKFLRLQRRPYSPIRRCIREHRRPRLHFWRLRVRHSV